VAAAIFLGLLFGFPETFRPLDLVSYLGITLAVGATAGSAPYAFYWRARHPRKVGLTREDLWRLVHVALVCVAIGLAFALKQRA